MSESHLNYIVINISMGNGFNFKLNDMKFKSMGVEYDLTPCLASNTGAYHDEDYFETIILYTKNKGIGVIPAIDFPSHARRLLSTQPQFQFKVDNSLDIYNDKAVHYALGIYKKYAEWFAKKGCKYFDIGGDEWPEATFGNGYDGCNDGEYVHFLNEVSLTVASYGLIPMIWNDPIQVHGNIYPIVNRESIVSYWAKPNQSEEYAGIKAIHDAGYELVNSKDALYWVINSHKVTEEYLSSFDIKSFYYGQIASFMPKGARFCTWIGAGESPNLNDGGDNITAQILPLISAFGNNIYNQFLTYENKDI